MVTELMRALMAAIRPFVIIVSLVAALETLRPATRPGRWQISMFGRLGNIAVFGVNFVAVGLVFDAFPWVLRFPWILPTHERGLMDVLVPSQYHHSLVGVVVTTATYAAVWDYFQYWAHRAQHEVAFLWPIHEVHHSDPCMNSTTAGRQSIAGSLFGFFTIHVPTILVVGPTMLTLVGSTVLFSGWGFLNHANVRLRFGRLTSVVSGPQLHRMHHGKDPHYHDQNYAAFFPVLDRLFGTLLLPETDEWATTGTDEPRRPLALSVACPWRLAARRHYAASRRYGQGLRKRWTLIVPDAHTAASRSRPS